jgi:hypothetical protein
MEPILVHAPAVRRTKTTPSTPRVTHDGAEGHRSLRQQAGADQSAQRDADDISINPLEALRYE